MMKTGLSGINKDLLDKLFDLAGYARANKTDIYLVGGVVRDLLLKKTVKDLDLVVEGDAIGFVRGYVRGRGKVGLTVHPPFKTATLLFPDGHSVDVASARKETYSHPGALPVVRAGTIADDLSRRDFTVNALALPITPEGPGDLVDRFDGRKDLRKKTVRVLHDKSFVDDPTRILRAVRFEQRLGFRIEPRTRELLKEAVRRKAYSTVKPPRYFAEFRKVFGEADPVKVLRRLRQLDAVEPFRKSAELDLRRLAAVRDRMEAEAGPLRECLFWMALWEDWPENQRAAAAERFHLTRGEKTALMKAPEAARIIRQVGRIRKTEDLFRCLKNYDIPVLYYAQARTASRQVRARIGRFLKEDRHVRLAVDGHDLRKLGIEGGRQIGRVLEQLLELKVAGHFDTRAQELKKARELAGRIKGV